VPDARAGSAIEALVVGRVGVDLTPPEPRTTLAAASSFVRSVGGFGGNVGTGLARLGAATALLSAVGDDGHGEHVRRALEREGIETAGVAVKRGARTQVAFFEAWPPETFPVTFYRPAPAPDTLLEPADVAWDDAAAVPLVIVSAAMLAAEPARSTTLRLLEHRAATRTAWPAALTVLDLDWRPALWADPGEAPALVARAIADADVVIGSDEEFSAARLDPEDVHAGGARIVAVKHGAAGASVLSGGLRHAVPGIGVDVVCGLGAGDALTAAFTVGLLRGLSPAEALDRGNAAGAVVATRLLCSSAMPRPHEIDELLAGGAGRLNEARA
jgi:5-dehydro-2-deoxygluconokinase